MPVFRDEMFGPVLAVCEFGSLDEVNLRHARKYIDAYKFFFVSSCFRGNRRLAPVGVAQTSVVLNRPGGAQEVGWGRIYWAGGHALSIPVRQC